MDNLENDYESIISKNTRKEILIVRDVDTLVKLRTNYDLNNATVRLVLKHLDQELIEMLLALNIQFDIVFEMTELSYTEFELLKRFMDTTGNEAYVLYDIEGKTLFERTILTYCINHYNVKALLKSNNQSLYREWLVALTQYVDKRFIKKLNKTYVGTKQDYHTIVK